MKISLFLLKIIVLVGRNAEQPNSRGPFVAELLPAAPAAEQCFLGQVLGQRPVADEAEGCDVPERRRAAVAEDDLVALGE